MLVSVIVYIYKLYTYVLYIHTSIIIACLYVHNNLCASDLFENILFIFLIVFFSSKIETEICEN